MNRKLRSLLLMTAAFSLSLTLPALAAARHANLQNDSVSATEDRPAVEKPPTPGQELAKESREAAGEGENDHFKHSPAVRYVARLTGLSMESAFWLSFILNFAIIAGAVVWLSKKNLPGVFRDRTRAIQHGMEEARRASEEANQRLSEVEARLGRLDSEIAAMRETADREIAAEEARLHEASEAEARRIVQTAEQEIAAAAKSARRELTAYAADLAVSLAKKQIHVDTGTDQALVRNFVQQLGEKNGSKSGTGSAA